MGRQGDSGQGVIFRSRLEQPFDLQAALFRLSEMPARDGLTHRSSGKPRMDYIKANREADRKYCNVGDGNVLNGMQGDARPTFGKRLGDIVMDGVLMTGRTASRQATLIARADPAGIARPMCNNFGSARHAEFPTLQNCIQ